RRHNVSPRNRAHASTKGRSYTRRMRLSILPACLLWASAAYGAVVHVPIKSGLDLKPGEAFTITIDASEPTEIGWTAVQEKRCTMKCVQATDLTSGISYAIATPLGASKKYTPASGKISIEYKNVSAEPVRIDVYRIRRTCEAEACKFLTGDDKGRWL